MASYAEFRHPKIQCVGIEKDYLILSQIGSGKYGDISIVTSLEDDFDNLVMKEFINRTLSDTMNEIILYSTIKYPFLNSAKAVYWSVDGSNAKTQIIMEKGVGLVDIVEEDDLTTSKREEICYKLVVTLSYLQKKGIIYTDIKTDNMLIFDTPPSRGEIDVRLTDFGGLYRLDSGRSTVIMSYPDMELYAAHGNRIYIDPYHPEKGLRDLGPYDVVAATMWGLAITLIEILTGEFVYMIPRGRVGMVPISVYDITDDIDKWLRDPVRKISKLKKWHSLLKKMFAPHSKRPKRFGDLLADPVFTDMRKVIGRPMGETFQHPIPDRLCKSLPRVEKQIIQLFQREYNDILVPEIGILTLEYISRYIAPVLLKVKIREKDVSLLAEQILKKKTDLEIHAFVVNCYLIAEAVMGSGYSYSIKTHTEKVGKDIINRALKYICDMISYTQGDLLIRNPYFSGAKLKDFNKETGISDASFTLCKYDSLMNELDLED